MRRDPSAHAESALKRRLSRPHASGGPPSNPVDAAHRRAIWRVGPGLCALAAMPSRRRPTSRAVVHPSRSGSAAQTAANRPQGANSPVPGRPAEPRRQTPANQNKRPCSGGCPSSPSSRFTLAPGTPVVDRFGQRTGSVDQVLLHAGGTFDGIIASTEVGQGSSMLLKCDGSRSEQSRSGSPKPTSRALPPIGPQAATAS